MKKIILLALILVSCVANYNPFHLKKELHVVKLDDSVSNIVRSYRKEKISNNELVLLVFENKLGTSNNTYYVMRVSNLSSIYSWRISFFAFVDDFPVLISSKKDRFIDVNNYDDKLFSILTKYLKDDMLLSSIIINGDSVELGYTCDCAIIDDSNAWKVNNNKIIKEWKNDLLNEGILAMNKDYPNLIYYRVIKDGRDDRKIKSN